MIRWLGALLFCFSTLPTFAQEAQKAPAEAPASSLSANASEYQVQLDQKESRTMLGLFGQMSQFAKAGGSLQGYTYEAVFDYAVRDRLAAQFSIGQSLSSSGGISVLFTELRLGGGYAIFGDFIRRNSYLKVNSHETVSVQDADAPLLIADAGIDQILFNGSERIVPATGMSLGIRYDRNFYNLRASAMLRYGALLIAADQVSMLTAGFGLLLRF